MDTRGISTLFDILATQHKTPVHEEEKAVDYLHCNIYL